MGDHGQSRSASLPDGNIPGVAWPPSFCQGGVADALPPGPLLGSLTEMAVDELGRLSDDELVGVLQATQRQVAREQYKQVMVTAEFARRRQGAFEDAAARGVPMGCRPGGFPGEELAIELLVTRTEAGHRIDDAVDLTTRLPLTLAGMAAGLIDAERAGWIAMYTRGLSPEDAARADAELSRDAPRKRPDQVARQAARLEMTLAPDAVKARRERAKRDGQRVEARREASGNASLSGREMDTADAMAGKAYIDAVAALLREGGIPGTTGALRVLVYADLTQGRNPLDRLSTSQPAAEPVPAAEPDADADATDSDATEFDAADASSTDDEGDGGSGTDVTQRSPAPGAPQPRLSAHLHPSPPGEPGTVGDHIGQLRPTPVPAQINLIIPVGNLLGWSTAPAQADAWGLLDPDETRAVASAVSWHPSTRWCCTLVGPDGTALAHACARGQYPGLPDELAAQSPPGQSPPAQLAELIRRLNLTFTPVITDARAHDPAEEHYRPSRALTHLVRSRNATCDAPSCTSEATNADLDHTRPWPDGPTSQANLAPRCRRHHKAKQSPDWQVEKPTPAVTRWTLPSGRTHTTTPTRYDT